MSIALDSLLRAPQSHLSTHRVSLSSTSPDPLEVEDSGFRTAC
jgi:hypothetical protein